MLFTKIFTPKNNLFKLEMMELIEVPSLDVTRHTMELSSCNGPIACRTTSNIIVSCIVTITLCIWTSTHPNVLYYDFGTCPEDMHERTLDVWRRIMFILRRKWNCFAYRLPLFVVTIIYPEFAFSIAVGQNLVSRHIARQEGASPQSNATPFQVSLLSYFHLIL